MGNAPPPAANNPGIAQTAAQQTQRPALYSGTWLEIKELLRRIWTLENNGGGGSGTLTSLTATTPIVITPSPTTTVGVISHAASGVTPTTYGDASNYAIVTVDAKGHVTSASTHAAGSSSLVSPLTTKGDVWGYDSTNNRIPIGTDTYVLTADSAQTLGLKWAKATAGGDRITGFCEVLADRTNTVTPVASSFTMAGSNQATLADKAQRMQLTMPSGGTAISSANVNSIATPYTIDLCAGLNATGASGGGTRVGLSLSDGTKFWEFTFGVSQSSGVSRIVQQKWTNSTTISSTPYNQPGMTASLITWLRITDDGATRTAYVSNNGLDFSAVVSEATNTFLTPTKFGICTVNSIGATGKSWSYHFLVTASILGDAS